MLRFRLCIIAPACAFAFHFASCSANVPSTDAAANMIDADRLLVDARASDAGDFGSDAAVGGVKPIMIAAANYLELEGELQGLGPFLVYAWATDPALSNPARYAIELGYLQQIDAPDVGEMIMFSSHATLQAKLAQPGHVQELKDLGVSILGYNSEGFMTPAVEMNALNSPSPAQNPVAIYAGIARDNGFESFWGPIRVTADAVGDSAITAMATGGLDGVALQEQQFIENACPGDRVAAVRATANRYRSVAGAQMKVNVQIMPSRCLSGDAYANAQCGGSVPRFGHCAQFAMAIENDVDSYAIWASGPADRAGLVELIQAMRGL